MKIKLTERQLKKLTESISDENLNEGVIDFLKGGYELVKNLFKKFKDGELSVTEFKKELEKVKKVMDSNLKKDQVTEELIITEIEEILLL
jgi:hypothetical protein